MKVSLFKLPSPVRECSGNSTVLTNGAINTLTNSTAGIDLAFDSDWGVGSVQCHQAIGTLDLLLVT